MYRFARAPASHAEIERIFEERAAAVPSPEGLSAQ